MHKASRSALLAGIFALAAGTFLASALPAFADDQPGTGVTVQLVQPDDDTGWILTVIYGKMLEELGYTVPDPLTLSIPIAFQTISQGDAQIYPYGWFPLHNTYTEVPGFGAQTVGYVVKQGALQGYLVDRASAEEFGIESLDDFRREEVRLAFDRDGDSRADLVACPPGWGCEEMIAYHMDAFDLHDVINPIKAGYAASMADAIAAHQAGEPILFYTWTPNWTLNQLRAGEDVVWIQTPGIELPEEQRELADSAIVSGVEGCVADPCQLGWPVNDIRALANSTFLEENPAASTLLEQASIPIGFMLEQNAAMYDGENSPADLERHADEWIEANRQVVDAWLAAARESASN